MRISSSQEWIHTKCWVACFDILGFKNLVSFEDDESLQITFLIEDYEKTLEHLRKSSEPYQEGDIEYCWLSDTFVFFTSDDSARSYAVLQQAAKRFITECTYSKIPIRGGISVGHITRSKDNRSFMGKAFIDAFVYAEDQDWIGLLLTPTAIEKAKSYGLFPERHDFVKSSRIPMRKCQNAEVMAYRFQNGSANFSSPLITMLSQMRHSSGEKHHHKYDGTIQFIEENYRYIEEHS
jgi:hypothetical protein